jgi:hypothetical protein
MKYTKEMVKDDIKLILIIIVATLFVWAMQEIGARAMAVPEKSTNCVVSVTNPYENLPMVCKAVLRVPLQGSNVQVQGGNVKLQ